MSKINEVAELVEKGKAKLVGPAVQEAIDEGDDPVAILNDGMISAMSVVGEKFKNGEIFVPEMLVAARAMKKGVEVLKPHLASGATGSMVLQVHLVRLSLLRFPVTFMILVRIWLP